MFTPFSFVGGGLYTTAMRNTNPFMFNSQAMCANCELGTFYTGRRESSDIKTSAREFLYARIVFTRDLIPK